MIRCSCKAACVVIAWTVLGVGLIAYTPGAQTPRLRIINGGSTEISGMLLFRWVGIALLIAAFVFMRLFKR